MLVNSAGAHKSKVTNVSSEGHMSPGGVRPYPGQKGVSKNIQLGCAYIKTLTVH